jgi:hypothetical protein
MTKIAGGHNRGRRGADLGFFPYVRIAEGKHGRAEIKAERDLS